MNIKSHRQVALWVASDCVSRIPDILVAIRQHNLYSHSCTCLIGLQRLKWHMCHDISLLVCVQQRHNNSRGTPWFKDSLSAQSSFYNADMSGTDQIRFLGDNKTLDARLFFGDVNLQQTPVGMSTWTLQQRFHTSIKQTQFFLSCTAEKSNQFTNNPESTCLYAV